MPKTKKRASTKRAARIAKAHATELPKLQVKAPPQRRDIPRNKAPARGIARYPWATFFTLLFIAAGVYGLYFYHLGPFTPPQPKPKVAAVSPCVNQNVVNQLTDVSPAPGPVTFGQITHTYKHPPATFIDIKKIYCVGINTSKGLIVLALDPKLAPNTVNNFVFLAEQGFYDGLVFHRVVANFVIQTGDPKGNGQGGPGYKFNDEPVKGEYTAGAVAMANSGPNTNGSQFFICTVNDTQKLQKQYNLFGYVVKGMDVVGKIQGPGDDPSTKKIKSDVIDHVIVFVAP